jgi:transcriptional regulator with XRE-family HTH domain
MPNKISMDNRLPAAASTRIKDIGHRIRLARIRRGLSVAEVAAKAGINRNTLTAIELGKPGVGLAACITVLWALGLDKTLDAVAHPDTDLHGKTLEASRRPERVRKSRKPRDEYDF